MTSLEKHALYTVLLRLTDDNQVLTPLERRDIMNQIVHAACGITADDILSETQNNRKLRIKRGDTTANDAYTGVSGELTLDTDKNTLRIHDGTTQGGHLVSGGGTLPENIDYVIESQTPTAENNYTWYRKYKSGWIEQGGITAGNGDNPVNLVVTMQDINYSCIISTILTNSSNNGACTFGINASGKTTTSFIVSHNAYLDWKPYGFEWSVRGFVA